MRFTRIATTVTFVCNYSPDEDTKGIMFYQGNMKRKPEYPNSGTLLVVNANLTNSAFYQCENSFSDQDKSSSLSNKAILLIETFPYHPMSGCKYSVERST